MTGPAEVWDGPIADADHRVPDQRERLHAGRVWDVLRCSFTVHGVSAVRDVLAHPGAVVIVAVNEDDAMLLIRQYRHPVGGMLIETPAGLLDTVDADPWQTAQRELAEEAGLAAGWWRTLLDVYNSSGGSSESIRIFLAREVRALPGGRVRTGEPEEEHLPAVWVPINEVVDAALAGHLGSVSAVVGSLAAQTARQRDWQGLRPPDAPWPARERVRAAGLLPRA